MFLVVILPVAKNWEAGKYDLSFVEMQHGKGPHGEYLLFVFKVAADNKKSVHEAFLLLSPVTDLDKFKEHFEKLTGKTFPEYKPTPHELESICRDKKFKGEIVLVDGVLRVAALG